MPNLVYIPTAADVPISVFKNVTDKHAYDYTLQGFINIITGATFNRYKATIDQIRRTDKATDKERYNALKRTLCAFTISCRCEQGSDRTKHSERNNGVICVDIDKADNERFTDWRAVRDSLAMLPYVYLSALSVGGNGVFAVIAVNPQEPHGKTFDALSYVFRARYGINLDKSCRDVNRLRYISYDAEAVAKQPTEIFNAYHAEQPKQPKRSESRFITFGTGDNYARIRAAVNVWQRKSIALEDYADWLKAAAALKDTPNGFEMFDAISQYSTAYKGTEDTRRKFEQAKSLPRINEGSFFHLCRQYGITDDEIRAEIQSETPTFSRALGDKRISDPNADALPFPMGEGTAPF